MKLPETLRFMKLGWIILHIIAIPLIFFLGFLYCSLLSAPPVSP